MKYIYKNNEFLSEFLVEPVLFFNPDQFSEKLILTNLLILNCQFLQLEPIMYNPTPLLYKLLIVSLHQFPTAAVELLVLPGTNLVDLGAEPGLELLFVEQLVQQVRERDYLVQDQVQHQVDYGEAGGRLGGRVRGKGGGVLGGQGGRRNAP